MESYLHQLSGYSSIFVNNKKYEKAANIVLLLILTAKMGYIESFKVWYMQTNKISGVCKPLSASR